MPLPLAMTFAVVVSFLSPGDAARLVDDGATVLDGRGRFAFRRGHLPGAQRTDWEDFRDGWGRTGRLGADLAPLADRLAGLGVDEGRPVLVYGDGGAGFGEEGRLAWMLAYLGHPRVHLLDGGYQAWTAAAGRVVQGGAGRPRPGRFAPRPQAALRRDLAAVMLHRSKGDALLLDVRSAEEWAGRTPFWEARGGHLPEARHLDWRQLLGPDGRLLPEAELRRRLGRRGVDGTRPVVTYCTAGVRSAFVWAVLLQLGFAAANYDGSMWEWSARRELPLVQGGPE